jgi:uncharacterized alpha-E superfamily protein
MLSRNADAIYWMSRYVERAENVARFLAVNAHLELDLGPVRDTAQWEPLLRATGDAEAFAAAYSVPDERNVTHFMAFDARNPNSIWSCVRAARENARALRDVIPTEVWEALNALHYAAERQGRKRRRRQLDTNEFLAQVRNASHLLTGLLENTMSHGEAWHFARMGRIIERADKTARLLDLKYFSLLPAPDYVDTPYDAVEWGAVLKSVSGFEMYRKRFHGANYRDVAEFLVLDLAFPRSIRHCVHTACHSLRHIADDLRVSVPAQRLATALKAKLDKTDIASVLRQGIHEFADEVQQDLNALHGSLHASFFDLAPERRAQPEQPQPALPQPKRKARAGKPPFPPALAAETPHARRPRSQTAHG